jgi:hypothetical protein
LDEEEIVIAAQRIRALLRFVAAIAALAMLALLVRHARMPH